MLENVVLTFLHWIPVSADAKSVFVGWTMFLHQIPVSTSMLIYPISQTEIFTLPQISAFHFSSRQMTPTLMYLVILSGLLQRF